MFDEGQLKHSLFWRLVAIVAVLVLSVDVVKCSDSDWIQYRVLHFFAKGTAIKVRKIDDKVGVVGLVLSTTGFPQGVSLMDGVDSDGGQCQLLLIIDNKKNHLFCDKPNKLSGFDLEMGYKGFHVGGYSGGGQEATYWASVTGISEENMKNFCTFAVSPNLASAEVALVRAEKENQRMCPNPERHNVAMLKHGSELERISHDISDGSSGHHRSDGHGSEHSSSDHQKNNSEHSSGFFARCREIISANLLPFVVLGAGALLLFAGAVYFRFRRVQARQSGADCDGNIVNKCSAYIPGSRGNLLWPKADATSPKNHGAPDLDPDALFDAGCGEIEIPASGPGLCG